MHFRLVASAGLALCSAGVAGASAQVQPPPLRFVPPPFVLRIRPPHADSARRPVFQLPPSAVVQCPMPVAVPDSTALERMPTAHVAPPHDEMPIAPHGCVNPLGPQSRSHRAPVRPPHP
jgi:hypothetical protein